MNTEQKITLKDLAARTSGFTDDEPCMCMDCDDTNIPYKEFKKGGKHHGHRFMPDDAWTKKAAA